MKNIIKDESVGNILLRPGDTLTVTYNDQIDTKHITTFKPSKICLVNYVIVSEDEEFLGMKNVLSISMGEKIK